jgi:hypothetical protein
VKIIQGLAALPAAGWLMVASGDAMAAESAGKLRSEMAKVEKEYVDLYNKLNADRQFDIVCRMDTPTGSNFAVRVCQPRYLLRANEKAATERMQAAVGAGSSNSAANANGPNAGVASPGAGNVAGQPDLDTAFRQNLLAVQQKSPELQTLGKKRDDLQARYEDALKSKGSGR